MHPNPDGLMSKLRVLRRNNSIDYEVSIVRDIKEREIRIYTDAGRISRPLFVVGDDQKCAIKHRHINMLIDKTQGYNFFQVRPHTLAFPPPLNLTISLTLTFWLAYNDLTLTLTPSPPPPSNP